MSLDVNGCIEINRTQLFATSQSQSLSGEITMLQLDTTIIAELLFANILVQDTKSFTSVCLLHVAYLVS